MVTVAPTRLHNSVSMLALLAEWAELGWIRDLDLAFAATLQQRAPETQPATLLAAALVSYRTGHGDLLLDLAAAQDMPDTVVSIEISSERPTLLPAQALRAIPLEDWLAELRTAPPLQGAHAPLVLDGSRLYLRRYWQHERTITHHIEARLTQRLDHDEAQLAELLTALFPTPQPDGPDWQQRACALAAQTRFAVITGGPGTGKTTTVVRLLALLQALALAGPEPQPLRIRLAAPTGKAAARLNESIARQVDELPLDALAQGETVRAAIPTEVITLHRLLGARPHTRAFRYHRHQPLALDVVVVDEASMIDIEMMAALLDALPPHARVILLGDKDQLASVEAGAVLGNLCARAERAHYNDATSEWLQRVTGTSVAAEYRDPDGRPLDQVIAMLRYSHRFGDDSGIGRLARSVNQGDTQAVERFLEEDSYNDLNFIRLRGAEDRALTDLVRHGAHDSALGYAHYLQLLQEHRPAQGAGRDVVDAWARDVLAAHGRFQLLCALRNGPYGVEALNERIEASLQRAELLRIQGQWYEGRPVLVTGNDYGLGLMNGDLGVTLRVPLGEDGHETGLRVAFAGENGRIRWVLPSRLQRCETVFAMTVHKSQGSEFEHAALVLPETLSPVLTRELLYTAITRARRAFTLLAPGTATLRAAVAQPTRRASGLFAPRDR